MRKAIAIMTGVLAALVVLGCPSDAGQTDAAQISAVEPEAIDTTGEGTFGFWKYTNDEDVEGGICIKAYTGAETQVTVPSTIDGMKVTSLAGGVFFGNEWIESVTIPNSVKYLTSYGLDDCCFGYCKNLTTIRGMSGVIEIKEGSFYNCPSLKSLTFGNALQSIGAWAFYNCSSLNVNSFPKSLRNIGNWSFGNTGLTNVTLSSTVKVGQGAFQNCSNLTSASIDTYVPSDAFRGCRNLATVSIAFQGIGSGAFQDCEALSRLTLIKKDGYPGSVGENAFQNCKSLSNVSIPGNVRNIYGSAFDGCTSLSNLSLSHGLLEVGAFAFCNIAAKDIILPNSVISIGRSAFNGEEFVPDSITIPNSVTNLYYDNANGGICSKSTAIKGYAGSAAQRYANEHGFQFSQMQAVPGKALAFQKPTLYLNEDKDQVWQLNYTKTPANTTDAIVWESSAPDIVSVNGIGEVCPKSVGSATIVATMTSGIRSTMNVVVSAKPTEISLDRASATIMMGSTLKLKATVWDRNGVRNDIIPTFQSSNTSIATVSGSGAVKGIREGVVTITASTSNLSATCKVTVVSNKPRSVSFKKSKKTVVIGHTSMQKATIMGSAGKISAKPSYKSSNPKVASVDKNGKVKGLRDGTVKITAKVGNLKAVYKVTVVTAKLSKSGRTLKITTIPKAKVNVRANKNILGSSSKNTKANAKGQAKMKFKRAIRGTRVTVTVKKSGYKTKKIVKKF